MYLGVSVEDRSSQQRRETHFNPNSSLIIRTMFSPSFFSHFFSPSLVQFSRHHNQGKDAWIQMSSGRRSLGIKHTSTFWSSVGFNSKIDGFALLIFGGRSAPPDANGGRQNQPTRVWWLRRFRWMSLSSDGRLSPRSVTHVTLSRGLHRWNRIHFHNAKCPCVPYAWLPVKCVHCGRQWWWGGGI